MPIKQIIDRSIANNSITGAKISTTTLTTSNIVEGVNLYFTNARAYSNVVQLNYITASSLNGYATNSQLSSYATTVYVNNEVANLIASAPTTLDTLNELAAALGDDPNFATTTAVLIGQSYNQANLAFAAANAAGSSDTVTAAFDKANTAYVVATTAFSSSNTKVATVAGITSTSISNTGLLDGIKAVDGSGSGLDADTLDGIQAASFAQLSGATFTGNVSATYFVGDGSQLTGVSSPQNVIVYGRVTNTSVPLVSGAIGIVGRSGTINVSVN